MKLKENLRGGAEGTRGQTARRSCPVDRNGRLRRRGREVDSDAQAESTEPGLWRALKELADEHRNETETDLLEDLKKLVKSKTNKNNDKQNLKGKKDTGEQKRENPPGETLLRRRRNRNPRGEDRAETRRSVIVGP